ncbi:MAG: hypothetical protein EXR79_07735 [Myxococcales bacterium]|nr:hypothetical protein [Myxococcales bacterium]
MPRLTFHTRPRTATTAPALAARWARRSAMARSAGATVPIVTSLAAGTAGCGLPAPTGGWPGGRLPSTVDGTCKPAGTALRDGSVASGVGGATASASAGCGSTAGSSRLHATPLATSSRTHTARVRRTPRRVGAWGFDSMGLRAPGARLRRAQPSAARAGCPPDPPPSAQLCVVAAESAFEVPGVRLLADSLLRLVERKRANRQRASEFGGRGWDSVVAPGPEPALTIGAVPVACRLPARCRGPRPPMRVSTCPVAVSGRLARLFQRPLVALLVCASAACTGEPSVTSVDAAQDAPDVAAWLVPPPDTDSTATAPDGPAIDVPLDLGLGPAGDTGWDAVRPFPSIPPALEPACVPEAGAFLPPLPATPTGDAAFEPFRPLRAVGEDEVVAIRALQKGSTVTDPAAPVPTLKADAATQIVSVGSGAEPGSFVAKVRFAQPGLRTLTVQWPDGRSATAQHLAYATPLAVWRLTTTADAFAALHTSSAKTFYPCTLEVGAKKFTGAQIRIHGGTSKGYPKKSLRIDLKKGDKLADGRRKLVLRAEWNDKTMLRNWLSLQLFRSFTWLPAPQSDFVHLRWNGEFYGLMHEVQRIGGDFLELHGRNPDGNLYEADPPSTAPLPSGANLTPLVDPSLYAVAYTKHAGAAGDNADLRALIEQTLTLPDAALANALDGAVKVHDFLTYAAAIAVLQSTDHLRKNYYLYRDPVGSDPRFEMLPWDLELTLGHLWTETDDTLSEAIVTDLSLWTGNEKLVPALTNRLWRALSVPKWKQAFATYAQGIAGGAYGTGWLDARLAWAVCRVRLDLLADTRKRATNAEYLERVEEIRAFAKARRAFVQQSAGGP